VIYLIDVDGVITKEDMLGEYQKSEPNYDVIKKVNKLYEDGHTIKIFTGRGSKMGIDWNEFTCGQLLFWGVKYHELIFGKPVCDVIWDDKAEDIWKA